MLDTWYVFIHVSIATTPPCLDNCIAAACVYGCLYDTCASAALRACLLPATHDASSFCALCCHYAAHFGAGAALRAYLSYTMPAVFVHSENSIVMLPIFISHARNSSASNMHERRLSTLRAIRQFQNCLVVLHFICFAIQYQRRYPISCILETMLEI